MGNASRTSHESPSRVDASIAAGWRMTALAGALAASVLVQSCGGGAAPASAPGAAAPMAASADATAFSGARADYEVVRISSGYRVTLKSDGTSTLVPATAATLSFSDVTVNLAIAADAAALPPADLQLLVELYVAFFNRVPDADGLRYWIAQYRAGMSIVAIADSFYAAAITFSDLTGYTQSMTNADFVKIVYRNVLDRSTPDAQGLAYWSAALDNGTETRGSLIRSMLGSAHTFKGDATWGFVADLLDNKAAVARDFAVDRGLNYTSSAQSITRTMAIAAAVTPSDTSAALALVPPVRAVDAEQMADDPFQSASLDSCRWFDWTATPGGASMQGGLRLATDAATSVSLPKVYSQYTVWGRFSAEATVTLDAGFDAAIPSDAQKYAALGLYVDERNYAMLIVGRSGNGLSAFVLRSAQGEFTASQELPLAGHTFGLRIEQGDGRLAFALGRNGAWTTLDEGAPFGGGEYVVSFSAATIGVSQAAAATFTDYRLSGSDNSLRPYVRHPIAPRSDFRAGFVSEGLVYDQYWGNPWPGTDPLTLLAQQGMRWVDTRVTTVSSPELQQLPASQWQSVPLGNYWQSQEVVGQLLQDAKARGINGYLEFYLSDTAANASIQNAPAAWAGLSVDETAARVQAHTAAVLQKYRQQGIVPGLYGVGNEILSGLTNFRPGERIAPPVNGSWVDDYDYMRTQIWEPESRILKAAIAGIRSVDPSAKIVLHITGLGLTPSDVIVKAFAKAMVDFGVPYDMIGVSLPYASDSWTLHRYTTDCWMQRLQDTSDAIGRLGKQMIISEASYPNAPAGNPATPMVDFPFTPAGQAAWLRETLRFAVNTPNVAGFMYFYPDWYPGRGGGDPVVLPLETNGFFDANRSPLPALGEYRALGP